MQRNLLSLFFAAAILLGYGGLWAEGARADGVRNYTLSTPIIENGDWIDIAGSFSCVNKSVGEKSASKIKEIATGIITKGYKYAIDDGTTFSGLKIVDRFYALQIQTHEEDVTAGFLEVTGTGFSILMPDASANADELNLIAKRFNITFLSLSDDAIKVGGSKGDLLAFLKAHNPRLVASVTTCVRN